MSDFDSSLPVRTEAAGDVDIFVSDATTPTQKLKVNADGSIDVNATAVDLDIRDLTSVSDSVEVLQDTHDDLNANANIQVGDVDVSNGNPVPMSDAGGSITVDATDLDIRDLNSASDSVEVLQDTHDDLNANANIQVGDTDVSNGNPVPISDAGGSITVDATDLDIRDLSATQDSVAAHLFDETGTAYSPTNPLSVVTVSDQAGDEICAYNTSAAVAKDASVNHDYTVTAAKTFLGGRVWVSGSGKLKVEVLINGATAFVGFNSTSNPNIEIPMDKFCKAGATEVVRITITNRDNQPQDLYSTLTGIEV